jgi:hypothetical protein
MAVLEDPKVAAYFESHLAAKATTGGRMIGHWCFTLYWRLQSTAAHHNADRPILTRSIRRTLI